MTKAGADIVVAHMGVTTGGSIGATSAKSLDDCVDEIDAIADAARSVRKDVILLCHGGPISMPDDARYILDRCKGLHGFYGARARWSGCRRKPRSPRRPGASSRSA